MLASALEWAYQAGSAISFLCCAFAVIVLLSVVSFLDALCFFGFAGNRCVCACVLLVGSSLFLVGGAEF